MTMTNAQALLAARAKAASDPEIAAQKAEFRKALDAEYAANWRDQDWHAEVAAAIEVELTYGLQSENVVADMIPTDYVGETDTISVTRREGIKVFDVAPGGYIRESNMTETTIELNRSSMGFHVGEFEDKLRVGFGLKMEQLADRGNLAIQGDLNRRRLLLAQSAAPVGASNFISSAGITLDQLSDALTTVQDAPRAEGVVPVRPTITGRRPALKRLIRLMQAEGGLDQVMAEEIRRTGVVGSWGGATINVLENFQDEDGRAYVPANEVLVTGGAVGRFAVYGTPVLQTWSENGYDYRHYRCRISGGGAVVEPGQIVRFRDTGVASQTA